MLKVIAKPSDENIEDLISLSSIKSFLRIEDDLFDEDLKDMLKAAINEVEKITNRSIGVATYEYYLEKLEEIITLPKAPLVEILEVSALDSEDNYIPMDLSLCENYSKYEIEYIDFLEMPKSEKSSKKAYKIVFKSGYIEIPADMKHWIKVRVATLFEFREEYAIGANAPKIGHIDSILNKYKIRV